MHCKLVIAFVIAVAATIAGISGTALAQNQTSPSSSTTTTTATNATTTTASNMTLDEAKKLYLSVWNQTEFNATFSTYVQPFTAAGYGVYEEHGTTFEPGESMVLYVELVGYDHMRVVDDQGNPLYLINMTADYIISDANGTELQSIEDVPAGSIVSHRPNTELFLELSLTQERPFPEGEYVITYVITDEVSGESAAVEKQVTVARQTASSGTV
ncbi:MAG TPA: hypothetical protein VF172_03145 [Nitrososphaera sp.]